MARYVRTLFSLTLFALILGLFSVLFITNSNVSADNQAGPFVSKKVRDWVVDYQQLTYTLQCLPPTTILNPAGFVPASDYAKIGENMVFASNNELANRHVIDQGVIGAVTSRGNMFPNEVLTCDQEKEYGFRWAFDNFERRDMVDFFCSLPGVYNFSTGGMGKTVAGGSNKEACKTGTTFPNSYYVAVKGHNLRSEAKTEFAKSERGRIASTPLSNRDKYIQYWLTFEKTCKAPLTIKYPTNSDPAADNGALFKIPVVNQNGDVVNYLANTGGEATDGLGTYLDATHSTPDVTCGELAQGMRRFAQAYSDYMKGPGRNDPGVSGTGIPEIDIEQENQGSASDTTCTVEGIGWIVCPVINFMADLNDKALEFLGDNFLSITPGFFESGGGTETAWKAFRDLANVAFVVAFLMVIYSQITGGGLTNYGIKKLLPKIIIAAILVNTSYFICQLAVDLSNIVGNSIASLMNTIPTTSADQATTEAGSWADSTNTILAAASGIAIGLVLLAVLGPTALLALGLVVLILIARKALIILLIVISPLAFVAYLLPNTEQWFKKWWKIFSTLLLLYPIIGLIFGASQLAAKVIISAGEDNELTQLTALGVMALPLFAVPLALKGTTGAMGALGSKLSNWQDKATGAAGKGAKEKIKRRGENIESRMANSNNRFARAAGGYRNRRAFRRKSTEEATSRNQEEGLLQHITAHPTRYNDQQRAAAAATLDKRYDEEVKAAGSSLQSRLSHVEILAAAENGEHGGAALSEHERDAAIRYSMDRGNFEERHAIATGAGTMTRAQRKSLGSGLRAKGDIDVYGNGGIAALEQTERTDEQGPTGMDAAAAAAALQAGVVGKINRGELSVDTVTKDHRVAGYVAGTAPAADAAAVVALRGEVADFETNNPQAWAKLSPETKARASSI